MVLHCSIRSPREGRLYYNRGAKGHVPLARKQSLSTCLMCPGVSGSWERQGRSEDGPEKWGGDGENPTQSLAEALLFHGPQTSVPHSSFQGQVQDTTAMGAALSPQWPRGAVEAGRAPGCHPHFLPGFMGIASQYWWSLCLETSRG